MSQPYLLCPCGHMWGDHVSQTADVTWYACNVCPCPGYRGPYASYPEGMTGCPYEALGQRCRYRPCPY